MPVSAWRSQPQTELRAPACPAASGLSFMFGLHDGGAYSGGTMDRPALQRLLDDVRAGKIDVVVVYKADRLTRSG